jgi:hypothetical protein
MNVNRNWDGSTFSATAAATCTTVPPSTCSGVYHAAIVEGQVDPGTGPG